MPSRESHCCNLGDLGLWKQGWAALSSPCQISMQGGTSCPPAHLLHGPKAACVDICLDKMFSCATGLSNDSQASDQPDVAGRDVI